MQLLHLVICNWLLHKLEQLKRRAFSSRLQKLFISERMSLKLHFCVNVYELHCNGCYHAIVASLTALLSMLTFYMNITKHPIAIVLLLFNFVLHMDACTKHLYYLLRFRIVHLIFWEHFKN
jgi:hypothetical protein